MLPVAPTEFTEAQKAEVETLAAVLTAAQMADYFGIGRTTFFAIMDRDPEVAERYKRGRARAVGSVAQSLITKARAGNVVAMIFYLKTQGGWRETSTIEHLGQETPSDHASSASAKLLKAIGVMDGVVLATGGLALDAGLIAAIGEQANKIKNFTAVVKSHPDSPFAGAIGAALWGAFRHEKLAQLGQLRQAS